MQKIKCRDISCHVEKRSSLCRNSGALLLLLMLILFLSACSITNTVRKHPQFVTLASKIKTISILPPEVVITHKALSESDKRSSAKEQHMRQIFAVQIPEYLSNQGINLSGTEFGKAFGSAAELTLEQLRSAYHKASISLRQVRVKGNSQKGFIKHADNGPIVSIGSVASYVSKQLATDALMIIRYIGVEISTDGVSVERLDPVMSNQISAPVADASTFGGVFEIALVDGLSGDVIWVNSNIQVAKPGQEQQNWEKVIRDLLQTLKFNKKPTDNPIFAQVHK